MEERKYYVYEWIRLDTNEPFYIGKGTGDRWKRPDRNKYFNNIVNKVGLNNISVSFIHEGLDEKTAFEYEVYYIYLYDFEYQFKMTNMTVGGEGTSGYIHTEESIKKMSESHWLKGKGPESHPMYGKGHLLEGKLTGEKNGMFGRTGEKHPSFGKKRSEESRRKMSEAQKSFQLHGIPVIVFKDGEIFKEFASIIEAAVYLESIVGGSLRNGITDMVNKSWIPKSGQLKGYSAMYLSDYEKLKENPLKLNEYLLEIARIEEERIKRHKREDVVIFRNGEYLDTFSSCTDAIRTLEQKTGGSFGDGLYKLLNDNWIPSRGRLKGYSAMYLSDYEKLQEDQLQKIS